MATTDTQGSFRSTRSERRGHILVSWLSSTDHKVIGYMYSCDEHRTHPTRGRCGCS
jgi:hypothetical protein